MINNEAISISEMKGSIGIINHLPELKSIWRESTGESEIMVAIIDGPADLSHPCFEGADINQLDAMGSRDAKIAQLTQNGTAAASIIFGHHASSVPGVSPGCRGLIVPVFSEDSLSPRSPIDLARAIKESIEYGANIININGPGIDLSDKANSLFANAIRLCAENGVLLVAAGRNGSCQLYSSTGSHSFDRSLFPRVERITVAAPGGGVAIYSGTRFAAPIVSGIAALLLSIQKKRGKKPDPNFVCEAILKSVHPFSPSGEGSDYRPGTAGGLDIGCALDYIQKRDR
jgi:subtilisin family serine protease